MDFPKMGFQKTAFLDLKNGLFVKNGFTTRKKMDFLKTCEKRTFSQRVKNGLTVKKKRTWR